MKCISIEEILAFIAVFKNLFNLLKTTIGTQTHYIFATFNDYNVLLIFSCEKRLKEQTGLVAEHLAKKEEIVVKKERKYSVVKKE